MIMFVQYLTLYEYSFNLTLLHINNYMLYFKGRTLNDISSLFEKTINIDS